MQAELLRLRKEKERLEKQKARGWTQGDTDDDDSGDEVEKELRKLSSTSHDVCDGRDQDDPRVTMRDR